jgi:hypothetical protein
MDGRCQVGTVNGLNTVVQTRIDYTLTAAKMRMVLEVSQELRFRLVTVTSCWTRKSQEQSNKTHHSRC